ncbi:MAG: hypothetical protein HOQ05_03750 [Corynebacteriales bacterium]|nr:hypothetical protein [Mycobacteriales bacterium]
MIDNARPPGYDLPAGVETGGPSLDGGTGGSTKQQSPPPQSPTAEAPKGDAAVESREQLDKAALTFQDASQLGIKYYDGKTKRGEAYTAGLVTAILDNDGGVPQQSRGVFLACAEKGAPRFKITVEQSTISMSGDPVTLVHSDPLNAVVPGSGLCTAVVLPPLDHEFPDASAIHGITVEDQDGKEVHIWNENASSNMVVNPQPSPDSPGLQGTANFNQAAKKSGWKSAITNTEIHQKLTQ